MNKHSIIYIVTAVVVSGCASGSHVVNPGLSEKDILTMQKNIEYLNRKLNEQQRAIDGLRVLSERIEIVPNAAGDEILRVRRR